MACHLLEVAFRTPSRERDLPLKQRTTMNRQIKIRLLLTYRSIKGNIFDILICIAIALVLVLLSSGAAFAQKLAMQDPASNAMAPSLDGKAQLQALDHSQPLLHSTFRRNGTVTLLAALVVHAGNVIARHVQASNDNTFLGLLKKLDRKQRGRQLHRGQPFKPMTQDDQSMVNKISQDLPAPRPSDHTRSTKCITHGNQQNARIHIVSVAESYSLQTRSKTAQYEDQA